MHFVHIYQEKNWNRIIPSSRKVQNLHTFISVCCLNQTILDILYSTEDFNWKSLVPRDYSQHMQFFSGIFMRLQATLISKFSLRMKRIFFRNEVQQRSIRIIFMAKKTLTILRNCKLISNFLILENIVCILREQFWVSCIYDSPVLK